MIYTAETIILQSGVNPNMCMVIVPMFKDQVNAYYRTLDLEYYANLYYLQWMSGPDDEKLECMPIGDYIQEKLEDHGYVHSQNYEMFFSANWDEGELR